MKKKIFTLVAAVCLFPRLFLAGCKTVPPVTEPPVLDPIAAAVEKWEFPESYGRNTDFKVEISADGKTWETLAVYNVKNGHQIGDVLLPQAGLTYFGTPNVASLAVFDFTGTVGIRVTYRKGTLSDGGYVIGPASYGIKSIQDGDTVTFALTQDPESPRKVVFRPEGEWESQVLHIMTNVPEKAADTVDKGADNVYTVQAGAEIPRILPAGKDTYYFERGIHNLPGGWWADLDLGAEQQITSFNLIVPSTMTGGLCFEIQAKTAAGGDGWQTVYQSKGAAAVGNIGAVSGALNITARYVRLILNGNFTYTPISGMDRFIMRSYVREFRLLDSGATNVALGKAVAGSGNNFAVLTDGAEGADYGFLYAAETFAAQDGVTYYLEKGAVLMGGFVAENRENITIRGRGILDADLFERERTLGEGRNGSVHFERCKNVLVEGITIMNAPMWMIVINNSENVRVDGINLFGFNTNADGIHFSASKNAVATGCFIRTCDDLFVAYHYGDSDALTFQNSVLWSDGARVLLLGLASAGDIKNVVMKNCDVITYQNAWDLNEAGGMVQLWATGGRTISNVLIKDIRVDAVRAPRIAVFAQVRTGEALYYGANGYVDGVTFENITLAFSPATKSLFQYTHGIGTIGNVVFKNIKIDGTLLTKQNLADYFKNDAKIFVDFQNA